jgi:outer membrane protein OmpA-like peptidoglycan-associated protein
MTNLFDTNVKKLLWVLVPFILTGIISVVLITYETSTQLKVIQAQSEERMTVQKETYEMSKSNNEILQSKADEANNTAQHVVLQNELLQLGKKVDRLYFSHFTQVVSKPDTIYYAMDSSDIKPLNQWIVDKNYE